VKTPDGKVGFEFQPRKEKPEKPAAGKTKATPEGKAAAAKTAPEEKPAKKKRRAA
jgi:DNA topoisomerase-3